MTTLLPLAKSQMQDLVSLRRRMLSAIVLLVLSLNFGATYGFRTPSFLVPFILAFPLLVFFFFWESRQAPGFALLPSSTWGIPNFTTLIVFALLPLGWWSVNFVPLVEIFRDVHGESNIMAGRGCFPRGSPRQRCALSWGGCGCSVSTSLTHHERDQTRTRVMDRC